MNKINVLNQKSLNSIAGLFYLLLAILTVGATTQVNAQCPVGQSNVDVTYIAGSFNGENSWLLWDATAGAPIACENFGPPTGTQSFCVTQGNTIELYAWDTFGGGGWDGATIGIDVNENGANNGGCAANSTPLAQGPPNNSVTPNGVGGTGAANCPAATPADGMGGWPMTPGGFVVASCAQPPPANDLCTDAVPIACGSVTSGNTDLATADGTPFCGTSNTAPGVWYSFVGNGDFVSVTTCSPNTNYDTKLHVYTGGCAGLTCVGGNDDDFTCPTDIFSSTVEFCTLPGTTYLILVSGFSQSTGDFDLTLTCTPAPLTITCPADQTLDCTQAIPGPATTQAEFLAAGGTVTTICPGNATVTSSDVTTTTNCGIQVVRTYTVSLNGQTATCVQNLQTVDTTAPVITCPPGQTLTCFESVPNPINTPAGFIAAGGTISDDCTPNLADFSVFSTEVNNGGTNCPGDGQIVTRTYYVSDLCGNLSSCTQTFTYLQSTQGPVITSILPICYKYCGSLANPAASDITFTTDCSFDGTVTITGPQIIGQANCPGTIYRFTYSVTDDCGRTSAPATRDFIIGNDGPTIQCPSYSLLLECGDPNNTDYIAAHLANVSANTSCELGYTINHFPQNFNNITCNTTTVVTFVATDDCGRTASCTTVINISDNTAPVITSTYVDGVCNEAVCGSNLAFWFANWKSKVFEGLSATDACDSNVSWTTSPNSSSPNQDCPDGTAETTVTWFANDNCGNAGEISYTFYVVPAQGPDPVGQIMGIVATEETETVENVAVSLEGNSNVEMYETTEDGLYSFGDLTLEENYTVTPYLNENPLNGVSSFDLVLIAKHILQSELLDSPYKIIAADINQSGSVTTIDIVELRKLILHINEEFPNNTSWRFIESAFIFPVPTNPFASVFPEAVYINGLTEEEQHDFVGVKVGDVNGSAVANAMAAADDRTVVGDLVFQIADQQLKAGESYDVVFHADNFEAVHGYQFSLNFDEAVLKFANISAGELTNLNENNFGLSLLEKGVITTSWTNQQAQSLARNAEVFHVTFVAKADALLSDVLHVSSQYTKAEAYNANLDLMDVQLRFDGDAVVTNQFRLYQNTPNPFKQETVIGFDLPEASKATLLVYDVSGKLLKQVEGDFVKGYNSIPLSNDGLSPGLLHYQLVTPTGTASMKMILQ